MADRLALRLGFPQGLQDRRLARGASGLDGGLHGEFEVKAISTGAYVRNLEAEASAIDEARKGMERRQRALERHADRLRQYLKAQIERTGMGKIKNCYLTLRIQNNPAQRRGR